MNNQDQNLKINLKNIINMYEYLIHNDIMLDYRYDIINSFTKLGISLSDSEFCYYSALKNIKKDLN